MKKALLIFLCILLFSASLSEAGFLDNIMKNIGVFSQPAVGDKEVISGLKEALSVGTDKAVKEVSRVDGYLANQAIKILVPEKIQKVADILSQVGYKKQVDDFILSMNRAAERAAPKATSYFADAIK